MPLKNKEKAKIYLSIRMGGESSGVVDNVLECDIVVKDIEL